jgi:hypothetical protein
MAKNKVQARSGVPEPAAAASARGRTSTFPLPGLDDVLGIDRRSLAAFRIGVGAITLTDTLRRCLDFTAHYTERGVLPITVHVFHPLALVATNLFSLSSSTGWALFLVAMSVLTSAAVVLGLFTRWSWCLSWLLVLSIQNRNIYVTNGGDLVLRLLYFWGLFLPLGDCYSIDALRPRAARVDGRSRFFSLATDGLTVQIAFVYFFAAVLKSGPDWHADGTAVFYALYLDKYATGLSVWARQFPALLHFMTPVVWYFEFLAPCCLFVPYFFPQVRMATALALMAMHVTFGSFLRIGTFPWICIAGLCSLLPSYFWDNAIRWSAPIVAAFAPIARAAREAGGTGVRWAKRLAALDWPVRPGWWSRIERPVALGAELFAGLAMVVVLIWNIGGLPESGITLPGPIATTARLFGLDQRWDMFAPRPTRDDGWIVVPGELENGKPVDVWYLDLAPVNWAKPKRLLAYNYHSERWIKYFENLTLSVYAYQRTNFARYLCRKWNSHFPAAERLKSLSVYYMSDPTLPTGKGTPTPVLLTAQPCDGLN